jgi:hypothetical protein
MIKMNLLGALNLEIGLLINGEKSLEVKRLMNKKYKPSVQSNQSA